MIIENIQDTNDGPNPLTC